MSRVAWAILLSLLAVLGSAAPALGAWGGEPDGSSYSKASSLPMVATPTTSSTGRNVTVSWTAPGGSTPVTDYVVRRYNTSNAEQTILAGCAGTVTATSCTESGVPAGSWRYSVTAARGNWRGTESVKSANVVVAGPSLTLAPTTVNSLPTTLSGIIAQFSGGQSVAFRLDNATTGTVLTGSITPSTVPANGTATVSVTIPTGTTNGSHTVYAIGSGGDLASRAITVATPAISTSVIQKATGGDTGYLGRSKPYFVYANVTGTGNPPAGLDSVTANVANITPGTTAAPMTHGSYTVGTTTYNYRSAQLTSGSALTAGSKSYSLTATDTGGSTRTTNSTVTVDITAPSASNVQTTNVAGGTPGLAQAGDRIALTYSEVIDAGSILHAWTGTSTPVVVRLDASGATDVLRFYDSANATALPLGSVNLGRNDYSSGDVTFGATGTPSTMIRSSSVVTITLGTPAGAATTAAGTGTMVWTPSAITADRAGNASTVTARTEASTVDIDF